MNQSQASEIGGRMEEVEDELVELQAILKPLLDREKVLKAEAKDIFEEMGLDEYESPYMKINIVVSNRFSTTEFKKDYPDIYGNYLKQGSSMRVSFKK